MDELTSADKVSVRKHHAQLCDIAVKWLKRPNSAGGPNCLVAVSEVAGGWSGEIPDAIGFSDSYDMKGSTVIEVKVTRSDFLADRKKPHRQEGQEEIGMGNWRYYMAPEGLIKVGELPAGWGLIEVNGRGHCKVVEGAMRDCKGANYYELRTRIERWRMSSAAEREQWMLIRLLSRLGDPEKMNRERREQYANQTILRRLIGEAEDNLKLSRKELRRATRELEWYRATHGPIPEDVAPKIDSIFSWQHVPVINT